MDRLYRIADRLSLWAVWAGGVMMIAAAVLVSIDVFLREVFVVSMEGADEISGYLFAISTAWAFSFALIRRANVRIDAAYQFMPSIVQRLLDILGLVAIGGLMTFFGLQATGTFLQSVELGTTSITPLTTPLRIPQGFWIAGYALFFFTWAIVLVRTVLAFATGDTVTAQRVAGVAGTTDELDEALHIAEDVRRDLR